MWIYNYNRSENADLITKLGVIKVGLVKFYFLEIYIFGNLLGAVLRVIIMTLWGAVDSDVLKKEGRV